MIYMVETSWILVLKQFFLEYGCIMLHIYRDTWDYPCSMNVYDIILVGSTSIDAWRMSPCSIAKSSISQLHIVITIVKYISPLVHYPHYFCFSPSNITILTCQISERCWSLLVPAGLADARTLILKCFPPLWGYLAGSNPILSGQNIRKSSQETNRSSQNRFFLERKQQTVLS